MQHKAISSISQDRGLNADELLRTTVLIYVDPTHGVQSRLLMLDFYLTLFCTLTCKCPSGSVKISFESSFPWN